MTEHNCQNCGHWDRKGRPDEHAPFAAHRACMFITDMDDDYAAMRGSLAPYIVNDGLDTYGPHATLYTPPDFSCSKWAEMDDGIRRHAVAQSPTGLDVIIGDLGQTHCGMWVDRQKKPHRLQADMLAEKISRVTCPPCLVVLADKGIRDEEDLD